MDVINGFMDKNPTAESIGFIAKREGLAATHRKYRDSRVSLYKRMLTSVAKANNLEIAWEEVGRMTEFILRREVPATVDEGIEVLNNPKNDKFGINIDEYNPEGDIIGNLGPYKIWFTDMHTTELTPMVQIWDPKLKTMVGIIELDAMSHREFAPKTYITNIAVVADGYGGKGIVFRGYVALLKLGYSLLSDIQQTGGGMKIWAKLANTAGINVYAVSNFNRGIQFSSVDPDDLTDADFAVYHTGEGQKLMDEWLELNNDYEDLKADISLQDNERKDGRGLPQDEYDGMVDHAKMIKRELDVTKREYDAVSNSEKVGADTRLMATTDAHQMNEAIKKPRPEDTLGIKRADMPQVQSRHYPELFDYLVDAGATLAQATVAATSLKAVQGEFSDDGVEKMMKTALDSNGTSRSKPLLVSSDNYIIDGHHRWLASYNLGKDIPIVKISLPVKELLQLVRDFKHTTYRGIYEEPS
jgi:hypothetical protein